MCQILYVKAHLNKLQSEDESDAVPERSARKAFGRLIKLNVTQQLIVYEFWICVEVQMHFSIFDIIKFNIL